MAALRTMVEFVLWGAEDVAKARIHRSNESADIAEIGRLITAQLSSASNANREPKVVDKTESLKRILEAVPTPALVASPVTARILWVNKRLLKMYGAADTDGIVGKSLLDFIEASQMDRAIADLAKVVLGGSPPPVTYQLKRADGGHAAGQVSSVPLLFEGEPAMLSFVTDVSERERLVRSLRESQDRYQLLLDSMPGGMVVVVDGFIVYANDSLARALGFSSARELVDKRMMRFLAEDSQGSVHESREKTLLSGVSHPATPIILIRRDGSSLPTTAASTVIHWEGRRATQTLLYNIGDGAAQA